ncbi:MAG: hypothetical protein IJJ19_04470 [Erysipelotrichaceae bacterium]|nr:hypothetical protein [Erysipelotrichaceae bacterium]
MVKPVYVFSGFLDAGKTTAIKESLLDPNFNDGETTLIIAFEQGDVEYDEEFLYDSNSMVVYLDDIRELDQKKVEELDATYKPDRVVIELNGMQDDNLLFKEVTGNQWLIVDYLTFFDATQLKFQMLNWKQFVYNHVINSAVCYINRSDDQDLVYFRNNLKAINRQLTVVFLDNDGKVTNKVEQQLFDTSKPLVIDDDDYGLWYIDAVDNAERYDGCTITLKLKLLDVVKRYKNVCIMGRQAMVCCSNDLQNIGLTCVDVDPKKIDKNKFYTLKGNLKCLDDEEGFKTCVLYVKDIAEAEAPQDEYVSFN